MKIKFKNSTYAGIESFNKYSISMKKMQEDLKKAKETESFIWEQHIMRDLGIIDGIRKIQEKHGIKVLNYYCQSCADYSFIETIDGTKYIHEAYKGNLIKNSEWEVIE